MKKKGIQPHYAAAPVLVLMGMTVLFSQFLPEEIKARPEWEDFLQSAEITGSEPVGEGVTKPYKLYLKRGDQPACGVWKNPEGIRHGYLEGWRYEIAAYRMDKLLGIGMIPPTVEKEFNGKRGSLQLWVDAEFSLLDVMEEGIEIPREHLEHNNRMKYITRTFDSLIANEDRTQQNVLITGDWRVILIDHSRSFRSSPEFTERLMFGREGIQGEKMIRSLPRVLVERIRNLDEPSIKEAVGSYLDDTEIRAVLKRKILLLDEIEAMAGLYGEEKFYY